jgi:hypothetical protein
MEIDKKFVALLQDSIDALGQPDSAAHNVLVQALQCWSRTDRTFAEMRSISEAAELLLTVSWTPIADQQAARTVIATMNVTKPFYDLPTDSARAVCADMHAELLEAIIESAGIVPSQPGSWESAQNARRAKNLARREHLNTILSA